MNMEPGKHFPVPLPWNIPYCSSDADRSHGDGPVCPDHAGRLCQEAALELQLEDEHTCAGRRQDA